MRLKAPFRRLRAGNVLFEKIRMLQARELDGEALLEVAHDPALCLAEADEAADRRPLFWCSRQRPRATCRSTGRWR